MWVSSCIGNVKRSSNALYDTTHQVKCQWPWKIRHYAVALRHDVPTIGSIPVKNRHDVDVIQGRLNLNFSSHPLPGDLSANTLEHDSLVVCLSDSLINVRLTSTCERSRGKAVRFPVS